MIWVTESRAFEIFMVVVIILNTVLLASQNYESRINPDGTYVINMVNIYAEVLFFLIFVVEFFMRIVSMGFIMERGSYLRDPYNWIDFAVVVTSSFPFIPYLPNTSGVKALRMLRPLRSINSLPRVRTLVIALFRSLPNLGNVVIFLLFMLILSSIVGVMLFMNSLEYRCRTTLEPEYDGAVWPITEGANYLCGWKTCPESSAICASAYEYGAAPDDLNIPEFNYGLSRFDNILWSLFAVSEIFSSEGWSNVLYIYWDKVNPTVTSMYFDVVIFLGSFFLLNLILAVISDSFEKAQVLVLKSELEKKREKEMLLVEGQEKETKKTGENDSPVSSQPNPSYLGPRDSISEFILPTPDSPNLRPSRFSGVRNNTIESDSNAHLSPTLPPNDSERNINVPEENQDSARDEIKKTWKEEVLQKISPSYLMALIKSTISKLFKIEDRLIPERAKRKKLLVICYRIVFSPLFTFVSLGFIAFNSVAMAMDQYPSGRSLQLFIFFSSFVCNLFFSAEMILKIIALGVRDFVRDKMNIFDLAVVFIGFVEFFWGSATGLSSSGSAISAFRSFRLFRIFKLASSWISLRELLKTMYKTLKDIANFSVLLGLFVVVCALIGREIFAYRIRYVIETGEPYEGKLDQPGVMTETQSPRVNFDTLGDSLVTIFILLTSENWSAILRNFTRVTGFALPVLFIIPTLITGNYILLNLFVAILLSNFKKSRLESIKEVMSAPEVGRLQAFLLKVQQTFQVLSVFLSMRKYLENKWGPAVIEDSTEKKKKEARKELKKGEKENFMFPEHIKPSPKVIRRRLLLLSNRDNLLKSLEKQWGTFNENDKLGMLEILGKEEAFKRQEPEGFAFYFWKPTNKIRKALVHAITHPVYDIVITIIIFMSGIVLALDFPLWDPDSAFLKFVYVIDLIVSILFVLEFLMKVVALGFLFNGAKSYLRSGWNILDFTVVIMFFFSLIFNETLAKAKIFRIIRVLRPMRIVSKSEELQLVINCLLRSIKGIISVVLVCLIFFFIFGIFGTNYFKGAFYDCDMSQIDPDHQLLVLSKWDCLNYGGDWVNSVQNFDNIFKAMAILFQVATTEGWIEVMQQGVDAVGPNYIPIVNHQPFWSVFFISFLIISTFFVLNLFAGIIVDSFNREKNLMRGYHFLTKQQANWVNVQIFLLNTVPVKAFKPPKQNWRKPFYKLIHSKPFHILIMCTIAVNTVIFLFYYNRMPVWLENTLDVINLILVIIFSIECILKIIALGKDYFFERWNLFDFSVVLFSLIGLILDVTKVYNLRTTISVLRSIRVISFIRLVKQARGTRMIINTFLITLPSLFNVGALLFLVLYVFSILGISLFPYIKFGEGITRNSNFHHFGTAFMTLFRVSTGEDWYLIEADCLRFIRPNNICFDISDWDGYQTYGLMGCGINQAYIFFLGFIIIFTFVLLNLFVAIILEAFSETSKIENFLITPIHYINFQREWSHYDPEGTSLIPLSQLVPFLKKIPPPLGPVKEIFYSSLTKVEYLNRLQTPIYYMMTTREKFFHYYDILLALTYLTMEAQSHFSGKIQPEKKLKIHYMIEKERIKKLHAIPHIYRTPFTSSHYMAIVVVIRAIERLSKKRRLQKEGLLPENPMKKQGKQPSSFRRISEKPKERDEGKFLEEMENEGEKERKITSEVKEENNLRSSENLDETIELAEQSLVHDDSMTAMISDIKTHSISPTKAMMEELFRFPNEVSEFKEVKNSKSLNQKTMGNETRKISVSSASKKPNRNPPENEKESSSNSENESLSKKSSGFFMNAQTTSNPQIIEEPLEERRNFKDNEWVAAEEPETAKEGLNKKDERNPEALNKSGAKEEVVSMKNNEVEYESEPPPVYDLGPPPFVGKAVSSQIDNVTQPFPMISAMPGGRNSQPFMKRDTTEDKRLDKQMRMVKNSGKIMVHMMPNRDQSRLMREEEAAKELIEKNKEKPAQKMSGKEAEDEVRKIVNAKQEPKEDRSERMMSKKRLKPNAQNLESKELLTNKIQVVRDPFGALERGEYPS